MKYLHLFLTLLIYFLTGLAFAAKDDIQAKLVKFSPEIYSKDSSIPCQGLQVTSRHIFTSEGCQVEISKYIKDHHVKAVGVNDREIGVIEDIKDIYFHASSRLGSQMILPIERKDMEAVSEVYVGVSPRQQAIDTEAYFIESEQPYSAAVSLSPISRSDQLQYEFMGLLGSTIPLGAPVVNGEGDVVCIISSNKVCVAPDYTIQDRYKRSDGACQVKFFQCSNPTFTACYNNGNGEGTCTNDHTGEVCGVATYPNGFNANYLGQNLYCNSSEGCEVVVCPSSCTDPANCTCRASYKLNDLIFKTPCDCIEYTDSSLPCGNGGDNGGGNTGGSSGGVSPALTYGLGFGIPVAVAFVGTVVAFIIYYYRVNKQARATPFSRMN